MALVGKNKGHPAVFPVDLPLFFIKLLCPENGLVVDPFAGSGTTGIAALSLGRSCLLIDNNLAYCQEAINRLQDEAAASMNEISFFRDGAPHPNPPLIGEGTAQGQNE
jgi:DNA modification methylase